MTGWFSYLQGNKQDVKPSTKGDNFVSLASHELRSPLSIVKWYTEMLLDGDGGDLTSDQTKYLKIIQSANQRSIDLVRSLLNVSRLDLGTFSISPEPTTLENIASDVIEMLKSSAEEGKIILVKEFQSPLPTTVVDKQLCALVMKNIVSNAISFSKEDQTVLVRLSLVVKGEHVDGAKVLEDGILFSVQDHGIGIPDEDKGKVFSKLFRATNVKDSNSTGSGLGLYIAQSIVQVTGGQIWFVSEKEKGSTFYVTFPLRGMVAKEGSSRLD
jgi:signal transduction histidine kinase